MKKTVLFLLIIACVLTSLVSCGGGAEEVSVLYYTYSDTYISNVRGNMNKMFKSANLDYHNYDANGNQTTQTEQVDTAIAKGTRMLVVNIVDTGSDDAAKTIVAKAKTAGIPLIFFNRSVSEEVVKSYDKCVFVGTDYELAGHMQGELIGNYVNENFEAIDLNKDGKITYCLFKGQQGNAEAEARTKYSVEDANKILNKNGKPSLVFYDSKNTNGYLVDQDGTWSNAAANNQMKTILSAYSEAVKNMVELVIANSDEMALGAIAALNEAGYNKEGGKTIPVFGVDATDAARAKINAGFMTGTIRQDAKGMAEAIIEIANNFITDEDIFDGIEEENVIGKWRVNIPYSAYTGEDAEQK
jgi:methyl-galactoside transport system substrate-binding protein